MIESINEDTYVTLFYKDNMIYSNSTYEKELQKIEVDFREMKNSIKQEVPVESSKYVVYTRELDNAPYQVMFVKEKV